MSKKKAVKEEKIPEYYELNTEAVDRLVEANKKSQQSADSDQYDRQTEDTGEITLETRKEIKKYQSTFLAKIPVAVKALFIKYWFFGAICFFFYWGLGVYIENGLDLAFVLWLAIGITTDILLNAILRFCAASDVKYYSFMMFRRKKFWTFFANIGYALILIALVWATYYLINTAIAASKGLGSDVMPFGVEPFSFGLFYLLFDTVFILVRNAIESALKRKGA